MKIDDLVANLERNAQEQDKIMTEKIQSVTSQHLASYNELLQSNLKATQKNFRRPTSDYTAEPIQIGDHQQNYSNHISHNGNFDDRARAWQFVALQEVPRPNRDIDSDTRQDRPITPRSQDIVKSGDWGGERHIFHHQQSQESDNLHIRQETTSTDLSKQIGVFDRAKQLFERLQRLADRTRTAIRRLTNNDRQTERADTAINNSQSVFDRAERAITGANRQVDDTERQIKQREQQANDLVAEQQKALDRGKGFGFGR